MYGLQKGKMAHKNQKDDHPLKKCWTVLFWWQALKLHSAQHSLQKRLLIEHAALAGTAVPRAQGQAGLRTGAADCHQN